MSTQRVKSLSKGIRVMKAIADSKESITASELAQNLGMDKSAISRIVSTLIEHDFVNYAGKSKRLVVGEGLRTLVNGHISHEYLIQRTRPLLKELAERTGECAHLAVYGDGHVLYLDIVDSNQTLKVSHGVGTKAPLHCTALGKILLAYDVAPISNSSLNAFTHKTITDPSALEIHLKSIKANRIAIDDEEFEYGIRCVATALVDKDTVVGAIGISGPTTRLTLEKVNQYGKIVIKIAEGFE